MAPAREVPVLQVRVVRPQALVSEEQVVAAHTLDRAVATEAALAPRLPRCRVAEGPRPLLEVAPWMACVADVHSEPAAPIAPDDLSARRDRGTRDRRRAAIGSRT